MTRGSFQGVLQCLRAVCGRCATDDVPRFDPDVGLDGAHPLHEETPGGGSSGGGWTRQRIWEGRFRLPLNDAEGYTLANDVGPGPWDHSHLIVDTLDAQAVPNRVQLGFSQGSALHTVRRSGNERGDQLREVLGGGVLRHAGALVAQGVVGVLGGAINVTLGSLNAGTALVGGGIANGRVESALTVGRAAAAAAAVQEAGRPVVTPGVALCTVHARVALALVADGLGAVQRALAVSRAGGRAVASIAVIIISIIVPIAITIMIILIIIVVTAAVEKKETRELRRQYMAGSRKKKIIHSPIGLCWIFVEALTAAFALVARAIVADGSVGVGALRGGTAAR